MSSKCRRIRYDFLCRFERDLSTSKPPKHLLAPLPNRPPGRRPIGFRGNHQHGRPLYDIVYPTTKVPSALIPRFPLDWRNAGRFILTAAMARLENTRLLRHSQSLNFQKSSPCGPRCAQACCKDPYRCLCAWRKTPTIEHVNNTDNILMSYKGPVHTTKPLFTVPRPVARQNYIQANQLTLDGTILKPQHRYPVFNSRFEYNQDIESGAVSFDEKRDGIFKL